MEKENGDGSDAGKAAPDGLLDAAGLFGAYWGRDGSAGGGAAAQAQAQAQAALFGFGGGRYPPPSTLGVAANQAASLGLHPAASAAWWSMASHLAAQDYLHRLQASGLNFPPLGDPYSALSQLSVKQQPKTNKPNKGNERSGRSSSSSVSSSKEKPPSTSTPSSQPNMRTSYGFPKTSSPSTHHSQSLSSLASLNSLVSSSHQSSKTSSSSKQPVPPSRKSSSSSSSTSSSQKGMKERELALLRGDLMLAHAAAQGAYHAAVNAAANKGKNMSSLYPFGMGGTDKDGRHTGIDSLTGLPHTILSDPASVLGGVRLPPDTEIIKYTSSLAGPKAAPGSTNRGRKKTISLDPPQVSVHPSTERGTPLPSKRQKVDEYGNSRSAVEVIRLPNRPDRGSSLSDTPPPNLSDYAGISRELLQTIASQSGVSLAALQKQLAGTAVSGDSGLNLSTKSSSASEEAAMDLGAKGSSGMDDDAPLNLSLKPSPTNSHASDALSRLTSLSSSLNAGNNADRISRRKPGAKPRRVLPEPNSQVAESPRPKSSGSEDSESISGWPSREGRPRNLGRGVSKPKKNTVASLLAQSRALGLRPALAQQLLAETDLEKLKALLGETASTDSECPSDSCPSDSDVSESGRRPNDAQLRLPLALGWKRVTVIKGLSRNCNIKGDVSYTPPEPHAALTLCSIQEIHSFLEANPCPPLSSDNFSTSAKLVLGDYIQPSPEPGEPRSMNEAEITKRLEEARALAALTGPRPTPPPVDRRIELARRQQAARDARRDASARSRDQARFVRELERTERAELAKREKEVRSQQLLEHINKNRTQLTIEPLPSKPDESWKVPDIVGSTTKSIRDRNMPPISLTLIPVNGPKDTSNIPIKTINLDQKDWRDDIEDYNALDKMKDFAEKVAFDLPKPKKDSKFDFSLTKARKKDFGMENSLEKLIETYSRISEFMNGCDWSKVKSDKKAEDPKSLEQKYLDAKNEYMSDNFKLMPKEKAKSILKEVIDLSEDDESILTDIITKKISKGTFNIGKDGALSISVHPPTTKDMTSAKRKKHEEIERQKIEELTKRQQERELKRQQALLLKEQQKYITEERERRRQHTTFIRQLDSRRRWEERERRKHQNLLDRLLVKEKKLQQRRKEMELLSELRRPQEDTTLSEQKPLPTLNRVPGLKLPGQAMSHILHVFEFLHNFGQTLGFEVEALPTLNTLQMALLPDCCIEAEEELMQVLTQLLVCAIEDPGIPHPGRHTTLLGHAIRMGDITGANISEVLRIYLYANATGEVKALTGLTAERERERRIADHHQTDAELQQTLTHTKNTSYYEHLHNNATYKLSEHLRDKPFLALNATTKAHILGYLCDELLQNKSVLRQIDASLDHLNQLKKERYLLDMKIRKVRVQHQRKVRAEQTERQQALALERMQRLVEESTANLTSMTHSDEDPLSQTEKPDAQERDKESSPNPDTEGEKETTIPDTPPSPNPNIEESDKELSPLKDVSNSMKNKEMLNNNKDECSPADGLKDKDSVMGDCDTVLSDLESEGTQPEEDEDKNLSSEELQRKLEKLLRQSEQQLQQLSAGSHALRATCFGQDRYWRRYWSLGKCGGIFVEAMESAQPEIIDYQKNLEDNSFKEKKDLDNRKRKKKAKEKSQVDTEKLDAEIEVRRQEDALKSEMELKSIKSELNLSDHTQIIKYEPNKHATCSSFKMEEKYIQHKQTKEEEDMLDIEDSIPTAFLVQKPTHKPMYASQPESIDKPQEIVKVENVVKSETPELQEKEETKDQLVDNLEELRKMAEAVSSQLDAAKKAESEIKEEVKVEKVDIKLEVMEPEAAHTLLLEKMMEGKWFSILRHESSFLTSINEVDNSTEDKKPTYCDNEQTCSEVILCQGHKWDVSNNLHLLNDPSLFTLNSMVTSVQVPSNNIYTDSSLTFSGLDQDMMDNSFKKDVNGEETNIEDPKEDLEKDQDNDLEKELQADALKHNESVQKAKASSLTSLGLLNFNALSTYVTCDSPPPIQMSPDEIEQLESCKVNGLPKKVEGNFVPKDLRYGWWRITDPDQLRDVMDALHPRGVRERELLAAFGQHVPTVNNKLYIEKGSAQATELSISNLDRVIAQNGGYPRPDSPNAFSTSTARRLDMQVLGLVEALEERVAAASIQVKGWRPSRFPLADEASGAEIVARARHKLAAVEAHIERRYLKPPLVQSSTEAAIGAVLQAEHGNAPASSPHNSDGDGKDNNKGIARGLATWREAVARCNTSAQLAMLLQALEAAVAWDKSCMKANCQFCLCGDDEEQLLLCDGCDKGYHTYCFKPRMDKIPEGDWYCWECVNKARGERVCIVCGGMQPGRTIHCALCPIAYHLDCHHPPLGKNPRGKWYCANCVSRAPPKKPRNTRKRESRRKDTSASDLDHSMVPSPAPSHASTSTTAEDCSASITQTPEKCNESQEKCNDTTFTEPENGLNHHPVPPDFGEEDAPPPEKRRALQFVGGNGAIEHDEPTEHEHNMDGLALNSVGSCGSGAVREGVTSRVASLSLSNTRVNSRDVTNHTLPHSSLPQGTYPVYSFSGDELDAENVPLLSRAKKEKNTAKKLLKDMASCKNLLCEMEMHTDAWPFLLPVNTKQFPQYKKVIKSPMDISTIRKKLNDSSYKHKEDFANDVRLIFSNCEMFNEDDSPVGRAGHNMRQFFEQRWNQF